MNAMRKLKFFSWGIKLCIAYIFAFFLKLFHRELRDVWIVSERGDDARDNGYYFYRYLRVQHPELKVFYIIKYSSPDYDKVAELGNCIDYESFRHYVFYALCKCRISSSLWGGDLPVSPYFKKTKKYAGHGKKVIFLQHGITKDRLPSLFGNEVRLDMFVCGAEPEYQYILENYCHPENVVQYTGFARFDNLHDVKTKPQILIMPTFRKWLGNVSLSEAAASECVRKWNEILQDEELASCLEANEIELVFYPHYVLQKYLPVFHSSSARIHVAAFKDYDVQQLLIESKLLITDYSSVFFDFGYMGKPTIYYQFDRERYIHEHYDYTQGYFDYDVMGFGEVTFNKEQLLDAVNRSIQNGFGQTKEYSERIANFFPLHDADNCKRIYERILELGI